MTSDEAAKRRAAGVVYALLAYTTWGLVPLYWKLLPSVDPVEILAHRVVWSLVLVAGLVRVLGGPAGLGGAAAALRGAARPLFSSAVLIAVNWGLFIWAVQAERIRDASLGYFVNPLMNVVLGVAVLGEKLRRAQWVAVALAALGVALLVALGGGFPWVALVLATTFAAYGLVRKLAPVESLAGLLVETVLLAPLALGYVAFLELGGRGVLSRGDADLAALVAVSGVVTALPLVWFTAAARRLPLSVVGFFQYISPSLQLLLATVVYDEPVEGARWVAFALIWVALAVHTADMVRRSRGS